MNAAGQQIQAPLKTRFDIAYDNKIKGHEKLTVRCNFPECEGGEMGRIERTFFADRARARLKRVMKIAKKENNGLEMERYIVCELNVGGTVFTPPAAPTKTPGDVLAELGRMEMSA